MVFAQHQGYNRSDKQLEFFRKCGDHHKSWDSICNIYCYSMASELIWPFVENNDNPTVDSYLEWANGQTDEIYKLKFEQVKFLILTFNIHLSIIK
jgi:hypothetical protein